MTVETTRAADGTTLAYRRFGPRDADRRLVMLHGFTGDHRTLVPLAELIHGQAPDVELLLIDLVGHGRSAAPDSLGPYEMPAVVDQVLSIIGPVPVGHTHLLGYSMGGRVVLSIAARAPWFFGSITTLSSTAGIEAPVDRAARHEVDCARADELERHGLSRFLREWVDAPLFAPWRQTVGEDAVAASIARRGEAMAVGYANSLRGTGTGSMPPVWDRLASIRSPMLFVTGALDSKFVDIAESMVRRAHDGRHVTIGACGHVVHEENPHEVARVITEFLEGLSTGD